MSDPDHNAGSGLGAGVTIALIAVGGVLLLLAVGALLFGFSVRSSSSTVGAYPVATTYYGAESGQESGNDESGSYVLTTRIAGPERQWCLARFDNSGKATAAVFGVGVPPPHERATDGKTLTVRTDLVTDAVVTTDGSKFLQIVTPRGVRQVEPNLTGDELTQAIRGVNSETLISTLHQIADSNAVTAILQPASP